MSALNDSDLELIERDSALPGLRCVLDSKQLIHELGCVPGIRSKILQSGDFHLEYVRYKPGMNCLGRYAFTLDSQAHLAYVKAFGPDATQKLSKSAKLAAAAGTFGRGQLVLPDLGLLFSFFPNDAKLRSIARLGDIASRQRLLGRIFKQDETWQSAHYAVLNYKPERRLVCRFENKDGRCSTVKFYTPHEFTRTRHLMCHGVFGDDLPVPRRLGGSRKHCVHAFEWLRGSPLRQWSLDPGSDIAPFRETGQLLALLHSSDGSSFEGGDGVNLPAKIEALASQLSFILPEISNEVDAIVKTLSRFAVDTGGEPCPVHGDFYDKQLIVGPHGLGLIDLDQARSGLAAEDLGCFIAHLEWLAIEHTFLDKNRVALLAQAMVAGYRAAGGRYDESDVMCWTAISLFQLSHQPFRGRAFNWPGQTRKILHRVRSLLGQVPCGTGPDAG